MRQNCVRHLNWISATVTVAVVAALGGCGNWNDAVVPPPPPIPSAIRFITPPPSLTTGDTVRLNAAAYTASGSEVPGVQLRWSSSDSTVATVSASGIVTGLHTGRSQILVTALGLTASNAIKVLSPALVVTAANFSRKPHLGNGDSVQLGAVAFNEAGFPVAMQPRISWWSSDSEHVTVSVAGLVTVRTPPVTDSETVVIWASANGGGALIEVIVYSFPFGHAASARFVNAAGDLGSLTLIVNDGTPLEIAPGEVRETATSSGLFHVVPQNFPTGQYSVGQSVETFVQPGGHVTVYAVGSSHQAFLVALHDEHPAVPPEKTLIRIVAANGYSPTWTNNVHLLPAGGVLEGAALFCYFDTPSYSEYFLRDAAPFDLVLVSPGIIVTTANPGVEWKRFHVTPDSGQATILVITGMSVSDMRLLQLTAR